MKPSNKDNQLKANIESFKKGKKDFTVEELNDIKLYLLKYKDALENTQFFEGNLKDNKVVSCFAEEFYDEILSHMLGKYSAAIAIAVVLSEKKILLKSNSKLCAINLCNLAKLLCDGDCINSSTDIAEGKITEKFLNLTKTFRQCS